MLYSSYTLAEDGDNTNEPFPENWEIIAVLTSLDSNMIEPMNPNTLLYNHFNRYLDNGGGTDTQMNSIEFEQKMKESFLYWRDKI